MALATASVLAEAWDCALEGAPGGDGYSCDIARPLASHMPRRDPGASGGEVAGEVQEIVYGREDGASGLFRVKVAGEGEISHVEWIDGVAGGVLALGVGGDDSGTAARRLPTGGTPPENGRAGMHVAGSGSILPFL